MGLLPRLLQTIGSRLPGAQSACRMTRISPSLNNPLSHPSIQAVHLRLISTTPPTFLISKLIGRPKPRFRLGVFVGGGSMIMFMWSIRAYKDSLVMELNQSVHPDGSKVSIGRAARQVPPTVQIVTGKEKSSLVDQESYSKFVQSSVAALLEAQQAMDRESSRLLSKELDICFSSIKPRAEHFADWYFSYSTSFRLLQEAAVSLTRHAAKFLEKTPLHEAVAADMDKFLTKKYERIVLRPEINNAELQNAYLKCVRDTHARYRQVVSEIEVGMAELLASETSHLDPPCSTDIRLSLDWASQLHKIKTVPANFEKSPELTLILSTAGAAVGKTLASKGVAIGTTKAMAGKLTAPFVSKVVAAGGGAAAGSIAGPLGTLGGAVVGLGVDFTVNAGVELVKREEFVKDVESVVDATRRDYFLLLEQELHRATKVWIEDAVQLLPRLGSSGRALPTHEEGNGFMLSSWLVSAAGAFSLWPARN